MFSSLHSFEDNREGLHGASVLAVHFESSCPVHAPAGERRGGGLGAHEKFKLKLGSHFKNARGSTSQLNVPTKAESIKMYSQEVLSHCTVRRYFLNTVQL